MTEFCPSNLDPSSVVRDMSVDEVMDFCAAYLPPEWCIQVTLLPDGTSRVNLLDVSGNKPTDYLYFDHAEQTASEMLVAHVNYARVKEGLQRVRWGTSWSWNPDPDMR